MNQPQGVHANMDTVAEYLHRAEECERMAEQIKSPERREAILKIAAAWRELAAQRKLSLRAEHVT